MVVFMKLAKLQLKWNTLMMMTSKQGEGLHTHTHTLTMAVSSNADLNAVLM